MILPKPKKRNFSIKIGGLVVKIPKTDVFALDRDLPVDNAHDGDIFDDNEYSGQVLEAKEAVSINYVKIDPNEKLQECQRI